MSRQRWILMALALLWAVLPYLLAGRLSLSVFVFTFLYTPIVIGLSLLAGYAGQVSLGQAAFFGLGAYTSGILTARWGLSPWLGLPAAVLLTAAVAYLLGRPILMLRGHYLALATLALNVVLETVMRQAQEWTGGANGLTGIPSLSIAGVPLTGDRFYYYATGLLTAAVAWLSANLVRSRVGRALLAIHASEVAAESLGVDPAMYKARIFAWSAALAAASGALYAHYLNFVSPSPFAFTFSIELLMMAVIGGVASIPGAALGAGLAVLVREAVREVVPRLATTSSAEYEIVVFGVLLALCAIAAPEGLWPRLARIAGLSGAATWRGEDVEPEPLDLRQPGSSEPLLVVEGLSRRFGGLQAVRNLSFCVRPGEVLVLIGPNGAGKTTVFNLISGVLRPSAGCIRLAGERVDGLPAHRIAALGVARTFQTPRLCPSLTALENVMLGVHRHLRTGFLAALGGRNATEERRAAAQALAALAMVDAAHLASARVDSLPFGALRAVELARALASRPRLLLLDEPGSGLAAAEKERLASVIRRLRDAGVAIVLVEHDLSFAMSLADRVVVLHHGELLAAGRPEEVRRDPRVIEAYLGTGSAEEAPEAGAAAAPAIPPSAATPHVAAMPAAAPAAASAGQQADWASDGVPVLLRVLGMRAGYGRLPVLHGVDFEVRAGELLAILGPNGAGKSTLMRSVAGLLPAHGEVWLDGQPLHSLPAEHRPAWGLVLVPERRQLLETMTVFEHLVLGAYCRYGREPRRAIRADMERVLSLFPELAGKLHQPARALSGGQQQMLAIARALMARPRVLLLDEPLLGLAPKAVQKILQVLAAMRQDGLAVVVVEQNAAAVLPYADRAQVLEGGRVVLAGPARQLLRAPELQAAFLGQGAGEGGERGV